MVKIVEEVSIVINTHFLLLKNNKNKCYFRYNSRDNQFFFQDSIDNIIQNYSATISINSEIFNLSYQGDTINMSDGRIIAYLNYRDILDLAEKTFYEDDQKQVYDFTNLKFKIEL